MEQCTSHIYQLKPGRHNHVSLSYQGMFYQYPLVDFFFFFPPKHEPYARFADQAGNHAGDKVGKSGKLWSSESNTKESSVSFFICLWNIPDAVSCFGRVFVKQAGCYSLTFWSTRKCMIPVGTTLAKRFWSLGNNRQPCPTHLKELGISPSQRRMWEGVAC